MDQNSSTMDKTTLTEIIAEEKLNLALRNIDHNLTELTEKLRKPKQQAQYVAENWRVWRKNALIGVAALAGLWLTKKAIHKFY